MPPEYNSRSRKDLALLIVIAVLLVAGVAYGIFRSVKGPDEGVTKENVVVERVNVAEAQTPESKLPEGFPSVIPIELANITESYSARYPDRGLTQYTVSFTSFVSANDKYVEYEQYMRSEGYSVVSNAANFSLYGRKENDDLSVVIGENNGETKVSLTFIDRS